MILHSLVVLKNERMKIEGKKRERKNAILHYSLEWIGKGKKSGLDGVFHLNLPFFFPYKEKRKENNINKKNKKSIKLPLIFHQYTFKNMSIIVIYSLSFSIILFFFFFFFILSKQYTINILIFHYYCTRVRFFIFYFFGSGINYQSQMSL